MAVTSKARQKSTEPTRYAAFLRGINVGGRNLVKMDDLSRLFTSLGFDDVKTYIQSGNVIFDSPAQDSEALVGKIEKGLLKLLDNPIAVFVRTIPELEEIVKRDPFKKVKSRDNAKLFVTFLAKAPDKTPKVPFLWPKEGVELLEVIDRDLFSQVHPLKNGRSGFPNGVIEKEFGVPATTRNWTTVCKMVETPKIR
ncbi:MAG: DUF1697 domain-containing protein [candidate division Zixibacteria bacterium]|nr:DUF1697 domain-containing protein [candidate division Zixibacteria bacterium]